MSPADARAVRLTIRTDEPRLQGTIISADGSRINYHAAGADAGIQIEQERLEDEGILWSDGHHQHLPPADTLPATERQRRSA